MPRQSQPLILILGQILLKKRWPVFVIGALVVAIAETIEHGPAAVLALDSHFLNELFFYGFVGPLIIWILLTMLARALLDMPLNRIQAQATRAERQRIARDLHDKLAQNLGYLHFKLDQLAVSGEANLTDIAAIQADLETMRHIANQAYEQVRGTLANLRSESEAPHDVAAALRQQAQVIAGVTGLDIKIDDQQNGKLLCPIVKHTIVNIAQEALTNVGKHATATQVTVRLACHQTDAVLTISDNGKGFDMNDRQKIGDHYGLDIMRERAEEVGGKLNIETAPNQGTQLAVRFHNAIINKPLLLKCEHLRCEYLTNCKHETAIS